MSDYNTGTGESMLNCAFLLFYWREILFWFASSFLSRSGEHIWDWTRKRYSTEVLFSLFARKKKPIKFSLQAYVYHLEVNLGSLIILKTIKRSRNKASTVNYVHVCLSYLTCSFYILRSSPFFTEAFVNWHHKRCTTWLPQTQST